jgi:hypothetical protein
MRALKMIFKITLLKNQDFKKSHHLYLLTILTKIGFHLKFKGIKNKNPVILKIVNKLKLPKIVQKEMKFKQIIISVILSKMKIMIRKIKDYSMSLKNQKSLMEITLAAMNRINIFSSQVVKFYLEKVKNSTVAVNLVNDLP